MIKPLSAPELKAWLADAARPQPVLLDVREAWELDKCKLDGIQHVPMREVSTRIDEILNENDSEQAIVCICHHGARSLQVANFLQARGVSNVYNLTGGVDAWARQVDVTFPVY